MQVQGLARDTGQGLHVLPSMISDRDALHRLQGSCYLGKHQQMLLACI